MDGSLQQVGIAKAKFKSQQHQHIKYEEIQKKIEEKLNQFKSMEPLKKETRHYKCERAWLSVVQEENMIKSVNIEYEKARRKKDENEKELAKYNMNDEQSNQQNIVLGEEIKQLQQLILNERQKLDVEKNKYKQTIDQISDNERNVKKLEAKINKVQDTIATLEETIQTELNSNKKQIDEMKQEKETKLNDLMKKQEDFEAVLKSHRRELEIYSNTRTKCQGQLDQTKRHHARLSDEKKQVERQLQHLNVTPRENLRNFGENMLKLVDTLEQYYKRGKFQKMPVGPLANHVEVKNAQYRQYVEDALGTILIAFCVDNASDLTTFREILKKFSFQVPVICAPFIDRQYNVSGKCVEPDNKTVRLLDLIVADNPVVMNCLIDQCNIETILITQSFDHATHLTSKKENVPSNLSRVILTQPYSEYFPAPAYRSYTKTSRSTRHLRVNAADRERALQSDLMEITEKLESIKAELQQIQNKIHENGKYADDRRKHITTVESNLQMLNMEIHEIQSIEYPQETDVDVMRHEVNEQTKILDTYRTDYEHEQGKVDELNVILREIKAKILEIRSQMETFDNDIQMKEKTKEDFNENLKKRAGMTEYHRKQNKHLTEAMKQYEVELEKLREKLNRIEAIAQKVGARVSVTHTEEQLIKLIKKNEVKLNAVNTSNESLEEVTRQAEEANEAVAQSENLITILGSALKMMHQSVRMRMSRVSQLKKYMITRTALYFTAIMKLRDIDGTLTFNEEAGTLEIQVVPRDKDCANAVSKTTNLSGGERSFTTVAFLLSLWTCVDHPFYFLDEYDVFTDQVNRRYMTDLLLAEAKKKPLQYTFLTPQDTSEIHPMKDLSILRLENPNR